MDGAVRTSTRIGVPRPDVAEHYDRPEARLSGFVGFVDLSDLPAHQDQVEIAVVVHAVDRRQYTLGTRRYRLERTIEPTPGATSNAVGLNHASRPGSFQRLLVFTHDLGRAGSQLLLLALLRHLAASRRISGSVVAPAGGATLQEIRDAGFDVHLTRDFGLDSADVYEARQEELVAWAKDRGFDLVLANALNSFPGIDIGARLALPTVWKINENYRPSAYWAIEFPPGSLDPHAEARAALALTMATILCVPRAARDYFDDPGRHVVSVLPAIDVDAIASFRRGARRDEIRQRLGLPVEAVVLIVLGSIAPRKMQALCVEAFAQSESRASAVLALVGDLGGPYAAAIKRFVEEAGLSDRIRIVPYTEDRFAWLAAADALICPSQFEGLPLSVLEAFAFELPVVATAVGELPAIIPSGGGRLVAPCDLEALADGIDWAVGLDQAERAALGRVGRSIVRSRHALPEYVNSFTNVLDEAYAARTG
jgi:glycosyltransferase involved in cell wall biosynthesis